MPELIRCLKRHKEIQLSKADEQLLLIASAGKHRQATQACTTADVIKRPSTTKPGTLLKNQIPIRTFADWDDDRPASLRSIWWRTAGTP